jgi:hypothetical protein
MDGRSTKHQVPRTAKPDPSAAEFTAALDALVPQLQADRTIVAALLGGSLSHDRVWEKSDIDLLLITLDDKLTGHSYVSLNADGVNVHAMLMQRAEFRKLAEGSVHQSFMHSFLAKSRVLFTHDDTIRDLCDRLQRIGERDTSMALLRAGTHVLPCLYKARKFLITRGDLEYTALWILYAATPLAQVEVISARKLVDREVIPQALLLNPDFFTIVYTDLLNAKKNEESGAGRIGSGRDVHGQARDAPLCVRAGLLSRCGRDPIGQRHRGSLLAQLRHRRRHDRLRIPLGSRPPRQGVVTGSRNQAQLGLAAGARVLSSGRNRWQVRQARAPRSRRRPTGFERRLPFRARGCTT